MQTKTTFTLLSASFLSLVLSACGGGDGATTLDNLTNSSSSIGSGGNSTVKIGSGSGANFVSGAIASTASAPTLFEGDKAQLSVTIVDGQNTPTASKLKVKFDSPCLAAGLSAIAGDSTVETINGTATVQYTVGKCDIDDKVTASLVVGSSTLDAFVTLPINTRRIGSGTGSAFVKDKLEVGIGENTLSAGGTTSIAAYIVNSAGELVSDTMAVTFSSPCLSANNATITGGNTVNTVNGKAEVSYVSKGCAGVGGADLVKATTTFRGTVLTATAYVFVKLDTVQTISFVDASPKQISLKGAGGLETSTVRFQVLGQAGNPVKGVCVSFDPSTTVGGLTLVEGKCGISSPTAFNALTDANGYASTIVQAGTVPTPVRVTASIGDVKTQSSVLVVSTGIPDQNSASLSLSDLAPNSWTVDGVKSTATIRLADAFNNPVPDGTAVTFTTNGGAIDGSCTTSDGSCPVEWRSQKPRPIPAGTVSFSNITETSYTMACSDGSKECRAGRVQILATAVGNESFIDGNSNGVYDDISKDIFVNSNGIYSAATKGLPLSNTLLCSPNAPHSSAAYGTTNSCDDLREAYIDKNFNLDRDLVEEFLDFNQNGSFDSLPNGKYDGALCSGAAKTNGDCTTNKVNVRQDATIVMSCGESPMVVGLSSFTIAAGETKRIPILVADCNGNAMPKGTSVSAVATDLVDATASLNISGGLPMSTNPSIVVLSVKADPVKTPKGATGIQVGVAGGGSVSFTVNVNPAP